MTKGEKNDTLFKDRELQKRNHTLLGGTYLHSPYMGVSPPPPWVIEVIVYRPVLIHDCARKMLESCSLECQKVVKKLPPKRCYQNFKSCCLNFLIFL